MPVLPLSSGYYQTATSRTAHHPFGPLPIHHHQSPSPPIIPLEGPRITDTDRHSPSAYHQYHHPQHQRLQQPDALSDFPSSTEMRYRRPHDDHPQEQQGPAPYSRYATYDQPDCSRGEITSSDLLPASTAPPSCPCLSIHTISHTSNNSNNDQGKGGSDVSEQERWTGGDVYCSCTPQYQCMGCGTLGATDIASSGPPAPARAGHEPAIPASVTLGLPR